MDRAAIMAMTDALAGSQKVFIMSSGTGFLGNTGPLPVSEEYPFDPDAPSRSRCHNERVRGWVPITAPSSKCTAIGQLGTRQLQASK